MPVLLLMPVIGLVVWGTGPESTPFLLILPVSAGVIGYSLRPPHVWVVWLGAVVTQWIAMGVLGKYFNPEGETVLSLILEAFGWMALGELLPLWLGRTIRNAVEARRAVHDARL